MAARSRRLSGRWPSVGPPVSGLGRGLLSSAAEAWRRDRIATATGALVLLGVGLLPLEAAATIEVVYTIRPSHILFLFAVVVGAPLVVLGWRRSPRMVWLPALLLASSYVLATVLGDQIVGAGDRGGAHRDLVYLGDLVLGLALVGLVIELMARGLRLSTLAMAFLAGATASASFAIYQWPAQHFGWPVSDVNNALNTDGVSRGNGDVSSDTGLLGWGRVRSTFREPHNLAAFLGVALPLVGTLLAPVGRRTRVGAAVVTGLIGAALGLTLSVPAWLVIILSAAVALVVWAVAAGRSTLAAGAAAVTLIVSGAAVAGAALPESFAALAGRSSASLKVSGSERTDSWRAAIADWEARPILGYGAGQSAVRLAGAKDKPTLGPRTVDLSVLGTAHGIWAAALVDAGILGLASWIALLSTVVIVAARATMASRSVASAALLAATVAAILGGLEAGDRLDLWSWAVIGITMGAATHAAAIGPSAARAASRGEAA